MVDDVRLALNGARPVEFYGRAGGNVPTAEEVTRVCAKIAAQHAVFEPQEVIAHA